MAANSGSNASRSTASRSRKTNTTSSSRTNSKTRNTAGNSRQKTTRQTVRTPEESAITNEVILIGAFAVTVLLFLCNFGVVGVAGNAVSKVLFGIFGMAAYAVPVAGFIAVAFGISNQGNRMAMMKLTAACILFFLIGVIMELAAGNLAGMETYSAAALYQNSAENKNGGGVVSGSLAYLMYHFLGMIGTVVLILLLGIICLVIITEKSLVSGVKTGGRKVYETARTDAEYRRERNERRREENAARLEKRREEMERRQEERERRRAEEEAAKEAEKILRMEKKVSGVMLNTTLTEEPREKLRDDIHEITLEELPADKVEIHKVTPVNETGIDFDKVRINVAGKTEKEPEPAGSQEEELPFYEDPSFQVAYEEPPIAYREEIRAVPLADGFPETESAPAEDSGETDSMPADVFQDMKEIVTADDFDLPEVKAGRADGMKEEISEEKSFEDVLPQNASVRPKAQLPKESKPETLAEATPVGMQMAKEARMNPVKPKPYRFPPLSLLAKMENKNGGDSVKELKETAVRLQQTLQNFGVKVTITDISQGPAVTRYELQPEQGVKVSKILSLSDDIKLNLAATDIRIEAPIPGKAAIGIEVPNKENAAVGLRELLETKEFRDFPSRLAFAVGKDIGGKVVVADIARMPHMLIAGATGSGKSVCINTLIMSLIYKASPEDVKLIMVDPKVVELSVYNGIPHLLIPVVTDPKKASAALQWGVAEMTDRYKKFADFNVRDLKGYNKKAEQMAASGEADAPKKLPQIVIIVDELADLMMVCPGEVEESICRLAQLARAAGIHLIIATQRPSVDVITGLIKANMPSRVAFSVSSGVDSRTILDSNGAEKLLGKGDMLFYPQGYNKPARVQGAFVSDNEVSEVVEFLKNQALGNDYSTEVEEQIKSMGSSGSAGGAGGGVEYDQYFADAGRFIIEKDKASIGMLQRYFKVGFNRAARIMDQLADAGVVGEEEGTKPRKVLMSMDEFDQFIEETL